MQCQFCAGNTTRYGRDTKGNQKFKCVACKRVTSSRPARLFGRMNISEERGLFALAMLADGGSIRGVERATHLHRDTVMKLAAFAGRQLFLFMDRTIQGVEAKLLQCDEVWTYTFKHDRRLTREERLNPDIGSQYIFTGIDRDSKLLVTFEVGKRTTETATAFMAELRRRVKGRPAISTDSFSGYREAVERTWGPGVDFGQLTKRYHSRHAGRETYAPARWVTTEKSVVQGDPEWSDISTSIVERSNATLRLNIRRLQRLTLAYSKRVEGLVYALAIFIAVYNFSRIHSSLRCTPAMAAGIARKPLDIADMLRAAA